MNWHKANQALGNIERLMQVFESSNNLSSIERDLLLRRIQDLYEVVLENETQTTTSKVKVTTEKPVVTTPPIVEPPKIEIKKKETVKVPKTIVEPPKVALPKQEPIKEVPKKEIPKKEIVKKKIAKKVVKEKVKAVVKEPVKPPKPPKIETPKPPVVQVPIHEIPAFKKPKVTTPTLNVKETEDAEEIEILFEYKIATDLSEKLSAGPIRDLTTSMSINERFITISELFKGNKSKYDEAVRELNNLTNFEEAKTYIINNLITEYNWTNNKKLKLAKAFIKKVRRRYL